MDAARFPLGYPSPDLTPRPRRGVYLAQALAACNRAGRAAMLAHAPTLKIPEGKALAVEFVFIPPFGRKAPKVACANFMIQTLQGIAAYLEIRWKSIQVTARVSRVPTPCGQVLVKCTVVSATALPAEKTAEESEG